MLGSECVYVLRTVEDGAEEAMVIYKNVLKEKNANPRIIQYSAQDQDGGRPENKLEIFPPNLSARETKVL